MPDLPSLDRLTDEVAAAMRRAERGAPRRRRFWPLLAVVLTIAVPTAVAAELLRSDPVVDVPGMRRDLPAGRAFVPPTGRTVVLATAPAPRGGYTFVGQRCGSGAGASFATGFFAGTDVRRSGGGFDLCPRAPRSQPVLDVREFWSPGRSWLYGIVRGDVAEITVGLVHRRRLDDGRVRRFDPRDVVVRTRPIPREAARAGRLPSGYRLVLLYQPRRSEMTRLVARDRNGDVVLRCAARECYRLVVGRRRAG